MEDRWKVVDPLGRSGGLLIFWSQNIQVCNIVISSFSIEVKFQSNVSKEKGWGIFVYASVEEKTEECNGQI